MADDTKDPKKKYAWSFKNGRMTCCTSETSTCNVSKLWEVSQLTSFHDSDLRKATKEINAILDGVKKRNKDDSRDLCLIQVLDRHFLVWTDHSRVGPDDDEAVVRKMLRLNA